MRHMTRFILVRSRAEAWLMVGAVTMTAAIMAASSSALVAAFRGQSPLVEAFVGFAIAGAITPTLMGPIARAALVVWARERELERLARTDPMTGVLNRRGFFAQAEAMFARATPQAPVCAVVADLDDFKSLNDAYGHSAGDAAITAAAQALAGVVEGWGGVVGRLGGDEFCALVPAMPELRAALLAERLRGALGTLLVAYEGRVIRAGASVGAAAQSPEDASLDALVARADAALYKVKMNRRAGTRPPPPTIAAARR